MPSVRSLFLYVVLSASCLQLSSAAPAAACIVSYSTTTMLVPVEPESTPAPSPTAQGVPLVQPVLPANGGGTELPAPTAALQFVTVGRGVQNYSCNATGAAPVAIGAIANLYDFTSLAYTSASAVDGVPPFIVHVPLASASGPSITVGGEEFQRIGHHYFDSTGTPVFDLDTEDDILFCKKIATVNAPPTADIGPDGTGAVPWLMLADKGGSVGLSQVYRVVTAGGKAPATCADTNVISVQYAAQYWFYS